jgi:hypothetical protein
MTKEDFGDKGKIKLKTSSMGHIVSAKGQAAKTIQSSMNNSKANLGVVQKSKSLAASVLSNSKNK